MKFTINSKTFLPALTTAGRIIAEKSTILILGYFLFDVRDGSITITASNTENRASIVLKDVQTEGEGRFCVEAKFLTEVVKNLPNTAVTVEKRGEAVLITTDTDKFDAVSVEGDEYPQSDFREDPVASFAMPTDALLAGFSETAFAVDVNGMRPVMQGVCMDIQPDRVVFVASDTRQLAKSVQNVATGVEAMCIIPPTSIDTAMKLVSKEAETAVDIYPSAIMFRGEGYSLRSQLIKGVYPPYNRVIPQDNHLVARVSRDDLSGVVRRAMTCTDSREALVALDFQNGAINVSAKDVSMNRSAKGTVKCEYDGQPITIGLSGRLLLPLLRNAASDTVELRMKDGARPVVIGSTSEDDHLTLLLMPMHLV